jgi:hypothetical protein
MERGIDVSAPGSLFFFCGTGDWTQGFTLAKQVFCLLSHTSNPLFSGCFEDWCLETFLPRLASNLNPSHLSLPSS